MLCELPGRNFAHARERLDGAKPALRTRALQIVADEQPRLAGDGNDERARPGSSRRGGRRRRARPGARRRGRRPRGSARSSPARRGLEPARDGYSEVASAGTLTSDRSYPPAGDPRGRYGAHRRPTLCLKARAVAVAGTQRIAGGVDVREGDRSAVSSERVDLAGRCVTPGFHDAHVHFLEWALAREQADLSRGVSTPQDVFALLRG